MDKSLLVNWAGWSTDRRRQALLVHDVSLAGALHSTLHATWKAEFQARAAGFERSFVPFSAELFPLLASMEFDGATDSGGRYSVHSVGWPASACEDPARIPAALAAARQVTRDLVRVPPRRWASELLSPPPQTWPEFEACLALLVEQLLVRAGALTGRAAKRQRQRERRREVRKLGCRVPEALGAVEEATALDGGAEEVGAGAAPPEPQPERSPLADARNAFDEDSEDERVNARRQFTEPVPVARRLLSPDDVDRALRADGPVGLAAADERCQPTVGNDAASVFSISTSAGSLSSGKAASSTAFLKGSAAPPREGSASAGAAAAPEAAAQAVCAIWEPLAERAERGAAAREEPHNPGCEAGLHNNASFSLVDSIRMQLEGALAALQAGQQDGCETRLKSAIELCSGLDPYLQSVNRPMSQQWDSLQRATQQVDWRQKYLQKETRDLFHEGMSTNPVLVQTLQFLCRTLRATRTLQIGLFTGGAALGIAEALPAGGRVVALEADGFLADFARDHLHQSPHGRKVAVQHGDIGDLLRELPASDEGDKFQVVFIDGSKTEYGAYLDAILERDLLVPGGVFVVDDVLWKGAVYCSSALGDRDHRCSCNSCWPSPWPSKLPEDEVASVLSGFNAQVRRDDRLEPLVLPIHNGVALIRRAGEDRLPLEAEGAPPRPSGVQAPPGEGPGGSARAGRAGRGRRGSTQGVPPCRPPRLDGCWRRLGRRGPGARRLLAGHPRDVPGRGVPVAARAAHDALSASARAPAQAGPPSRRASRVRPSRPWHSRRPWAFQMRPAMQNFSTVHRKSMLRVDWYRRFARVSRRYIASAGGAALCGSSCYCFRPLKGLVFVCFPPL
ncbi:unnamed protein product [Prorocentrum cordatum]|uniref:Caffeoyl-CoA O-methyltransferase n=1 Tax=Prorocentrum cordatum TaxID=2364126 RepID=A0ABN9WRC8_9DINO|nr:unnamed protein product [Polarella glacialis]